MKVIAVTQARLGSSRFPGKILEPIGDKTVLGLHLERIQRSKRLAGLVVATTNEEGVDAICNAATLAGAGYYKGSLDDVLDRFYQACQAQHPDYVVRLTSDCPLIDAALIDKVIDFAISHNLDYCSNTLETTYPDGQDVEVFTFKSLESAWKNASLGSEREHVTPYIWKNSTFKGMSLFKSGNFSEGLDFGHLRMTVDEPVDLELVRKLVDSLGDGASWLDYARHLDNRQELKSLNDVIGRNEGYTKSINKDSKV